MNMIQINTLTLMRMIIWDMFDGKWKSTQKQNSVLYVIALLQNRFILVSPCMDSGFEDSRKSRADAVFTCFTALLLIMKASELNWFWHQSIWTYSIAPFYTASSRCKLLCLAWTAGRMGSWAAWAWDFDDVLCVVSQNKQNTQLYTSFKNRLILDY